MVASELTFLPFHLAAASIRDGDLLLYRRRGLISIAGRGDHSHAAKAAWWNGELFCLEVREWHGGRAVTLDSQVRRFPGRIEVYQANPGDRWPEYDRAGATRAMCRLAGCPYGYWGVATAALVHLPLVRLLVHADVRDDSTPERPPFCSQACAMSDRVGGGVDPVAHLADRMTLPADLAQSVLPLLVHANPIGPPCDSFWQCWWRPSRPKRSPANRLTRMVPARTGNVPLCRR